MSDYLWDQTGAPDEDVREMEELLGGLAYRPRPFELPETLLASPARTSHLFSRGWLRIAAALLLMIVAGAVLMSIRQRTKPHEQWAQAEQQPAVETPRPEEASVVKHKIDESVGDQKLVAGDLTKPAKSPRTNSRTPRLVVAALPRKGQTAKRRAAVDPALTRQQIARHEGDWRQPKLTEEERRATEQLMLALRFASANLRYAQAQVREVGLNAASR